MSTGVNMTGKHNKCCCGTTGQYVVYVGTLSSTSKIFRVDPGAQTSSLLVGGISGACWDLACDPVTGYIYMAAASKIICFDSAGSTVWSTAVTGAVGVAVSPSGYVYAASLTTGYVERLRADNGATANTGGWPFAPGGGAAFTCLCVDQSDNIYAGGNNTAKTGRAWSADSTATQRWMADVSNNTSLDINSQGVYGIACNAAGTEVVCSRVISPLDNIALKSHYHLNASTGVITGTYRGGDVLNSGYQTSGRGQNCEYGPTGASYSTQTPANSPNDWTVLYNLGNYYKFPIVYTPSALLITAYDIAIGRDNREFITCSYPGRRFYCISDDWYLDIAESQLRAIETSEGRVGAFGI